MTKKKSVVKPTPEEKKVENPTSSLTEKPSETSQNITITIQENEQILVKPELCSNIVNEISDDSLRKRGRKPKGGKLFSKISQSKEGAEISERRWIFLRWRDWRIKSIIVPPTVFPSGLKKTRVNSKCCFLMSDLL